MSFQKDSLGPSLADDTMRFPDNIFQIFREFHVC